MKKDRLSPSWGGADRAARNVGARDGRRLLVVREAPGPGLGRRCCSGRRPGASRLAGAASSREYYNLNKPDNLEHPGADDHDALLGQLGLVSVHDADDDPEHDPGDGDRIDARLVRESSASTFNVKGVATACQPCSSTPVDVMLVIDRTGSMCQSVNSYGQNQQDQNGCEDLNNAKGGIRALLGIMDPNIDTVGLVAFPPYDSTGGVCGSAAQGNMNVIKNANTLSTSASQVDSGWYDSTALTFLDDPLLLHVQDVVGGDDPQPEPAPSSSTRSRMSARTTRTASTRSDRPRMPTHSRRPSASSSRTDARRAEGDRVHDRRRGQRGLVPDRLAWHPAREPGIENDLDNPATSFDMSPAGSASTVNPGRRPAVPHRDQHRRAIKASGAKIYAIGYSLPIRLGLACLLLARHLGQVDGSYASSATDLSNFRCAPRSAPR